MIELSFRRPVLRGKAGNRANSVEQHTNRGPFAGRAFAAGLLVQLSFAAVTLAQQAQPAVQTNSPQTAHQLRQSPRYLPPRVVEAERFLAQHGWNPGHRLPARAAASRNGIPASPSAQQRLPLSNIA